MYGTELSARITIMQNQEDEFYLCHRNKTQRPPALTAERSLERSFYMRRHVFLTGRKQVGKSTLIKKVLDTYQDNTGSSSNTNNIGNTSNMGNIGGFFTVRTNGYLPYGYSVHLYRADHRQPVPNENNLLFVCGSTDPLTPDRFDRLGCGALAENPDASLIIMDELGPHEAKALHFRRRVIELLNRDTPIFGVLQEPAEPYWPEIVTHPDVRIITITEENRNSMAVQEDILRILTGSPQ